MKYTIYQYVENIGRGLTPAGHANNRDRAKEAEKLSAFINDETVAKKGGSNGIYSGTDYYFEGDVSENLITLGASEKNIRVGEIKMDIVERSKKRILYDMQRTGKATKEAIQQLEKLFSQHPVWLYRWFDYLTTNNEGILSSLEVKDGFSRYQANKYIVNLKNLHWDKWVKQNADELMYVLKDVYHY